jgi:hypothetical protein
MSGTDLPDDPATTELLAYLQRGELPKVTAPDPLAPGDECHFVTPVRFGRRRVDQYGHVVLTSGWLKFRGTVDLSAAWDEIAHVQRHGREMVVSLRDSRRLLRFSCHCEGEATRGVLIAEYLAQSAQAATAESGAPFHYAAL